MTIAYLKYRFRDYILRRCSRKENKIKKKTERQLLDEIRWDEQKMETVDNNPLGNYGYWHEHNNSLRWNGWLKIEQMEALLNSLKNRIIK